MSAAPLSLAFTLVFLPMLLIILKVIRIYQKPPSVILLLN